MRRARALRLQVGALFAVVLAAFLGVNAVVLLAVRPQIERLEHIYDDLGESLHLLSQMRGVAADVRAAANAAVLAEAASPGNGRPATLSEVDRHLERLNRLGASYEPLITDEAEREVWEAIRSHELPELAGRARATVEAAGGAGALGAAESLAACAARVDTLLERLARENAFQVQRSVHRIDGSLRRLIAGCAILLVVGGAGAALLWGRALAAIRRYHVTTEARLAELEGFAARVAHDLRSPLQTIQLSLGSMERRALDDGVRTTAARAQVAVRRLNGMIADLLEFARSGATPEPGAATDLPEVFAALREEIGPVARAANVRLALSADPGTRVAVAPVAVRAILANLLENAIKYSREDGERTVEVTARLHGRAVSIAVRDNGIGIPREHLGTIFEPFVRANRRRDSYGLGLATVKRLVDAHRGTIAVESEEGVGSVFTVELPRAFGLAETGPEMVRRR